MKILFVMMQKRQREKIGQYIQAKCVNGFKFVFFDIHQTVTVRTNTKKKENNQIDRALNMYTIKKRGS
jgi:hypothetical protein